MSGDISKWECVVNDEVRLANYFTSIGLLTALSKKVRVSYPPGNPGSFPAYLSISFEGLGSLKGWFIVDTKNKKSSTWKKGEQHFFKDPRDRVVLENWDPVFDDLLTDIAKISAHGIILPRDAINYAAVKLSSNPSRKCEYAIRYFGSDFTGEDHVTFEKYTMPSPDEQCGSGLDYQAHRLLEWAVKIFIPSEFEDGSGSNISLKKFQQRYSPIINARIEQILKEKDSMSITAKRCDLVGYLSTECFAGKQSIAQVVIDYLDEDRLL